MASKGEEALGKILAKEFPRYRIFTQYPIRVGPRKRKTLFFDYAIPSLRLAFEVDGRQHLEWVAFFHKTKAKFLHGQFLDSEKEAWALANKYTIIRFSHTEKITLRRLRSKIAES